jgi:hypothetical protein
MTWRVVKLVLGCTLIVGAMFSFAYGFFAWIAAGLDHLHRGDEAQALNVIGAVFVGLALVMLVSGGTLLARLGPRAPREKR